MKKERLLYFDAIKFLAVIFVFVCHYARTLEHYQISYNFKILPNNIFSVYTGTVGTVLFFIVSGATLMYVYQNKMNLKDYFFKRIKGIYPMFWIAFIVYFCICFYIDGGYNKNIPIWKLFYTIIGFDGLMLSFSTTFYTVGEWFLGVLITLYIVFPLLRKLVNEFPYAVLTVSILVGIITDYTFDNSNIPKALLFWVWIPVFVFGMVFVNNIKNVKNFILIMAMVTLSVFTIFDLKFCHEMTRVYFVGISLFLILVYLFDKFRGRVFRVVSGFVSKYCYPIFLVHHRMMFIFMKRFSGYRFSAGDVICLFVFMILASFVASYLIDRITNAVLSIWRNKDA